MGLFDFLRKEQRVAPDGGRRAAAEAKASAAQGVIAMSHFPRAIWTPRNYAHLAREGFERKVVAYRCVRLVAEAAASAPLRVFEDGAPLDAHPLQALLYSPNADHSGATLLEAFYGSLQTSGNAYLEVVSIDGVPRELYCLRPDRMKVRLDTKGWPAGYEYTIGENTVRYDASGRPSPILHLKLFHPTNDHYGMSPLEAAAGPIDLHNAALAWNKALFDNAARPSGALIYKGPEGAENLTDEQFAPSSAPAVLNIGVRQWSDRVGWGLQARTDV